MLKDDKTLILFGRSPFINDIKNYIPLLCCKYHTIGCNYFVNSFPEIENVIFYDDLTPEIKPEHKIITNIKYYNDESAKCYQLLHSHENKELYKIEKVYNFSLKKDTLHMCIHTPSIAMNWAYFKGFKNVILAGVDISEECGAHFDKDTTPDNNTNDFNIGALSHARKHLEKIATRYLKIYQLNPESKLKIPKLDIAGL